MRGGNDGLVGRRILASGKEEGMSLYFCEEKQEGGNLLVGRESFPIAAGRAHILKSHSLTFESRLIPYQ